MQSAIKLTTTVLPGRRIEVTAPELREGDEVELIVLSGAAAAQPADDDILAFLDSLPPGPRSAPTWEELDRQLQAERDSWDR